MFGSKSLVDVFDVNNGLFHNFAMDNIRLILIVIAISPFVAWLAILYVLGIEAPDEPRNGKTAMRIKTPLDKNEGCGAGDSDIYFTRLLVHTPYIYT